MLLHLKTGDGDLALIMEPALLTIACNISCSPSIYVQQKKETRSGLKQLLSE